MRRLVVTLTVLAGVFSVATASTLPYDGTGSVTVRSAPLDTRGAVGDRAGGQTGCCNPEVERAAAGNRAGTKRTRAGAGNRTRAGAGNRTPSPARPGRPAAPGTVLWKSDGESPMAAEWASNSSVPVAASPPNPDPTRISQSTFRAQGNRSYRFEMRDGDDSYGERAELGQAMPALSGYEKHLFRAGQERWIAMQYYLPASWPTDDTWQTVFQIKPSTPGGGGPDIGLDAGGNRLMFYGNSNTWGSTAGAVFDGAGPLSGGSYPLTKGGWIKLTWHIVFSADPRVGALEVFGDLADGRGMRSLVPHRNRATMKFLGPAMDPVHLRVGIYRDPAMTATASLYVDGITVATTRAAAEANAYAGG